MKVTALFAAALVAVTAQAQADALVAKGARATLTVEYIYESSGKTGDKYDTHEWRAKRTVKLSADLVAQAPQEYSALHDMTSGQKADLKKKQDAAQSAHKKLAPMAADMEKIVARCGEDEACIEREVKKYGFAMEDSPERDSARKDIEVAGKQGPKNYQSWRPTSQKGTYSIEESAHFLDGDPLCMTLPGARCTRDETRKGSGEVPLPPGAQPEAAAGVSTFEVDAAAKTLTVTLPIPLAPLPYTQTVSTNKPGEKSGTSPASMHFPDPAPKPIQAALKGGSINQSGTEVVKVGPAGAQGTLTVRWQITAR